MKKRRPALAKLLRGDLLPMSSLTWPRARRLLLEGLRDRLGDYTLRDPEDPGIALLEAFAASLEVLGFYHDRILTEMRIGSATQLASLSRLGELVGFSPLPAIASSAVQHFEASTPGELPPGTRVGGKLTDPPAAIKFQTIAPLSVRPGLNVIALSPSLVSDVQAFHAVLRLADAEPSSGLNSTPESGMPWLADDFFPYFPLLFCCAYGLEALLLKDLRRRTLVSLQPFNRSYDTDSTRAVSLLRLRHLRHYWPLGEVLEKAPLDEQPDEVVFALSEDPILHLPAADNPSSLASSLQLFLLEESASPEGLLEPSLRSSWTEVADLADGEPTDRIFRTFVDDRLHTYVALRRKLGYKTLLSEAQLSRVYARFSPAIGRVVRDEAPNYTYIDLSSVTLGLDVTYFANALVTPQIAGAAPRFEASEAVVDRTLEATVGQQVLIQNDDTGERHIRTLSNLEGRRASWEGDSYDEQTDVAASVKDLTGGSIPVALWTIVAVSQQTTDEATPPSPDVLAKDTVASVLGPRFALETSYAVVPGRGVQYGISAGWPSGVPNDHDPVVGSFPPDSTQVTLLSKAAAGARFSLWDAFYRQVELPSWKWSKSTLGAEVDWTLLGTRSLMATCVIPAGSTFLFLEDCSLVKPGDFLLVGRRVRAAYRSSEARLWLEAEVVQATAVTGPLVRLKHPIAAKAGYFLDFVKLSGEGDTVDQVGDVVTELMAVPLVSSVYFGDFFVQPLDLKVDSTFVVKDDESWKYLKLSLEAPLDSASLHQTFGWTESTKDQIWADLFLGSTAHYASHKVLERDFAIRFAARGLISTDIASLKKRDGPEYALEPGPEHRAELDGGARIEVELSDPGTVLEAYALSELDAMLTGLEWLEYGSPELVIKDPGGWLFTWDPTVIDADTLASFLPRSGAQLCFDWSANQADWTEATACQWRFGYDWKPSWQTRGMRCVSLTDPWRVETGAAADCTLHVATDEEHAVPLADTSSTTFLGRWYFKTEAGLPLSVGNVRILFEGLNADESAVAPRMETFSASSLADGPCLVAELPVVPGDPTTHLWRGLEACDEVAFHALLEPALSAQAVTAEARWALRSTANFPNAPSVALQWKSEEEGEEEGRKQAICECTLQPEGWIDITPNDSLSGIPDRAILISDHVTKLSEMQDVNVFIPTAQIGLEACNEVALKGPGMLALRKGSEAGVVRYAPFTGGILAPESDSPFSPLEGLLDESAALFESLESSHIASTDDTLKLLDVSLEADSARPISHTCAEDGTGRLVYVRKLGGDESCLQVDVITQTTYLKVATDRYYLEAADFEFPMEGNIHTLDCYFEDISSGIRLSQTTSATIIIISIETATLEEALINGAMGISHVLVETDQEYLLCSIANVEVISAELTLTLKLTLNTIIPPCKQLSLVFTHLEFSLNTVTAGIAFSLSETGRGLLDSYLDRVGRGSSRLRTDEFLAHSATSWTGILDGAQWAHRENGDPSWDLVLVASTSPFSSGDDLLSPVLQRWTTVGLEAFPTRGRLSFESSSGDSAPPAPETVLLYYSGSGQHRLEETAHRIDFDPSAKSTWTVLFVGPKGDYPADTFDEVALMLGMYDSTLEPRLEAMFQEEVLVTITGDLSSQTEAITGAKGLVFYSEDGALSYAWRPFAPSPAPSVSSTEVVCRLAGSYASLFGEQSPAQAYSQLYFVVMSWFASSSIALSATVEVGFSDASLEAPPLEDGQPFSRALFRIDTSSQSPGADGVETHFTALEFLAPLGGDATSGWSFTLEFGELFEEDCTVRYHDALLSYHSFESIKRGNVSPHEAVIAIADLEGRTQPELDAGDFMNIIAEIGQSEEEFVIKTTAFSGSEAYRELTLENKETPGAVHFPPLFTQVTLKRLCVSRTAYSDKSPDPEDIALRLTLEDLDGTLPLQTPLLIGFSTVEELLRFQSYRATKNSGECELTIDPLSLSVMVNYAGETHCRRYLNAKDFLNEAFYLESGLVYDVFKSQNFLLLENDEVSILACDLNSNGFSGSGVEVFFCKQNEQATYEEVNEFARAVSSITEAEIPIAYLSGSIDFSTGNFIPVRISNTDTESDIDRSIISNALSIRISERAGALAGQVFTYDPTGMSELLKLMEPGAESTVTYGGELKCLYSFNKSPHDVFTLNFLLVYATITYDSIDPLPIDIYVRYGAKPHDDVTYEYETHLHPWNPLTRLVVQDPTALKRSDYLFMTMTEESTPSLIQWSQVDELDGQVVNLSRYFRYQPRGFTRFSLAGIKKVPRPPRLDENYYSLLFKSKGSLDDTNSQLIVRFGSKLVLSPTHDASRALLESLLPGDHLLIFDERYRHAWYAQRTMDPEATTGEAPDYERSDVHWWQWPDYQYEAVIKGVDTALGLIELTEPLPDRFCLIYQYSQKDESIASLEPLVGEIEALRILPHYREPFQGARALSPLGSGDQSRRNARYRTMVAGNVGQAALALSTLKARSHVYATNVEVHAMDPRSGDWTRWMSVDRLERAGKKDRAFLLSVEPNTGTVASAQVKVNVSFGDGLTGMRLPTGTDNVHLRTITLGSASQHLPVRRQLASYGTVQSELPFCVDASITAQTNLCLLIETGNHWQRRSTGGKSPWQGSTTLELEMVTTIQDDSGSPVKVSSVTRFHEVSIVEAQQGVDGFVAESAGPGVIRAYLATKEPVPVPTSDAEGNGTRIVAWQEPQPRVWSLDEEFYTDSSDSDPGRKVGVSRLVLSETDGLSHGSLLALETGTEGESAELVQVQEVEHDTFSVTLKRPLERQYDYRTASIRGNLVRIEEGASERYVIGQGDGTTRNLRLAVYNRKPILFTPEEGSSTPVPALTVLVDGQAWERVEDLEPNGPRDKVFRLEIRADGESYVVFGDGVRGAIPPRGVDNICVEVRTGGEVAGNLAEQQVNKLLDGNPCVAATYNITPASGGRQAETPNEARERLYERTPFDGRAVTEDDLVALAMMSDEVVDARLDPMATPPGLRLCVALRDPAASDQVLAALSTRLTSSLPATGEVRLEVVRATETPVSVIVDVSAMAGFDPSKVLQALQAAFSDGPDGFFALGQWRIGEPLRLGDLYEQIFTVAGVRTARVRWMNLEPAPMTLPAAAGEEVRPSSGGVIRCRASTGASGAGKPGTCCFRLVGDAT